MRRLKARLGNRARAPANDERDALRKQVDEMKRENAQLKGENAQLKAENAQLKGENTQLKDENTQLKDENTQLKTKPVVANQDQRTPPVEKPQRGGHGGGAKRPDEIDVDAFALCGARQNSGDENEDEDDKMRECRCLAALAHAQAAQRAVTFFALQDTLMSQALDGARPHLQALEASMPSWWPAAFKDPLLAPLRAQIGDLEKGVKKASDGEKETKARFIELRQHTTKPVTVAMRATTAEFVNAFDDLDVSAITAAVERLRNDHNLLGADDMAVLQRDGASEADARSLEFLQRLYAVAKAVQGPLGRLLEEIGKGVGSGVEVQMGKLKGLERVFEKTMEEYDGDFSRLGDVVRGSLVCDRVEEVAEVLERVSSAAVAATGSAASGEGGTIASLRVVRVKNRLDRGFDAEAESGGYRDVLVNVALGVDRAAVFGPKAGRGGESPSGNDLVFLVCEIQAHVRSFHDIKGAGGAHKLYKQARSLHLLDKELGQAYVHGNKEIFDGAMEKVERGECRAFRADFFQLDQGMATRLRDALLNRAVCSVETLSLHSALVDAAAAQVFAGHHIEGLREVELSGNKRAGSQFVDCFVSKHTRVLKFRDCNVGAEGVKMLASRLQEVRATDLQELDAAGNKMGSRGAVAIAPPLQALTRLTRVNLFGNDMGSEGAAAIAPSLKALTNVTTLNLGDNNMGSKGAAAIAPSLQGLANLATLFLQENNLGGKGAAAIAPSLTGLKNLTTLYLHANDMGSEGAIAIAPSLKALTSLATLYLGANDIGHEGAAAIAPSLRVLTNLVTLYLHANNLGSGGATQLAPSLQTLTNLTTLNLGANNMGSEGVGAIAPSLVTLANLTSLFLNGNDMGAEGAAVVAPSLKVLTKLDSLYLHENNLGGKGAAEIAPSLEALTNLTLLDLRANKLGRDGAAAIAPPLKMLTNLTALYLNDNDIGRKGAASIAPSLGLLTNLTALGLAGNNIGCKGAEAIAPSLAMLTNLETLILPGNDIKSKGAAAIATSLKSLPNLTKFYLNGNGLTDADKQLVRDHAPANCDAVL